jgi:hypothetical protein
MAGSFRLFLTAWTFALVRPIMDPSAGRTGKTGDKSGETETGLEGGAKTPPLLVRERYIGTTLKIRFSP